MFSLTRLKRRTLVFLAVFGPATITAIAGNDAAGVATQSIAGAQFGFGVLFVTFFAAILLALTEEMGSRTSIVSQRGLGDLIRERYGIKVSLLIFASLFVANMGTITANFAALKTTSAMFHVPAIPVILTVIIFSFLFISKGDYKTNQRIFLIGAILYFSYVFSALKAKPDWNEAVLNLVTPVGISFSREFVWTAVALVGTTVTPWGQFFLQSFVTDKKLSTSKLKYVQLESLLGSFIANFFAFFIIVATAATLFVHKIPLTSGEQAALAIRPFAGELAGVLFGVGLFNAALMGIVIISLSTAYAFAEFFGFEGSLDTPFERGKLFYTIFLVQLILAAAIALIPSISLFSIVLITQFINALLLPFIFFFLLKFTNDTELMGQYINRKWYNYFMLIATSLIVVGSLTTLITNFLPR